jgi:hypothetical protein
MHFVKETTIYVHDLGIPLDSERAVLVGRFFASVNIAACLLQIFIMPHVLSAKSLPRVLGSIPITIFIIVIIGFIYPSLFTTMIAFGTLKVCMYSLYECSFVNLYIHP